MSAADTFHQLACMREQKDDCAAALIAIDQKLDDLRAQRKECVMRMFAIDDRICELGKKAGSQSWADMSSDSDSDSETEEVEDDSGWTTVTAKAPAYK